MHLSSLAALPLRALALTAALLAGACASDDAIDVRSAESDQTSATRATAHFPADYGFFVRGEPTRGGQLLVDYDPARLPKCRAGLNDGAPGWTITGYVLAAGKTRTFHVAGHSPDPGRDPSQPAVIELEEAGETQLWFEEHDLSGCHAYDSNLGANYRLQVADSAAPAAKLVFGSEGAPALEGRLVKGSSLTIHYDTSRILQCSAQANLSAAYTIDGGPVAYASVKQGPASIALSRAGELALWFETNDQYGCHGVDSNLGANYVFTIDEP